MEEKWVPPFEGAVKIHLDEEAEKERAEMQKIIEERERAYREMRDEFESLCTKYHTLFPNPHDEIPPIGWMCLPVVPMEDDLIPVMKWCLENNKPWRECPFANLGWDPEPTLKLMDEHPEVIF